MQGIERSYCDVCLNALVGAWRALMEASAMETLRRVQCYGKGDTLGLDAITEITIASRLNNFDDHAILITEERDDQAQRRWPTDCDPVKQPLMFFCDPTDRSVQLEKFFERVSHDDPTGKIGDLMAACDPGKVWEEMFEGPVSITGPSSAITCVRKGKVVFSVIVGLLTGVVYLACDVGVYRYELKVFTDSSNEHLTCSHIVRNGKKIIFPSVMECNFSPDDCKRFVTFLGKTGYQENFTDSMIFVDKSDGHLHHKEPPGPPRTLYLSELQLPHGPIGFVVANGEKIGEWMHWLTFVKYAKNGDGGKALRVFEIALERPWTKNGMLMSNSPSYSVFCQPREGEPYLDLSRLQHFDRPSQYRSMLVVLRHDNERIIHVLIELGYREITDFF